MRKKFPFPFWLVPLAFFLVFMAVFAVEVYRKADPTQAAEIREIEGRPVVLLGANHHPWRQRVD